MKKLDKEVAKRKTKVKDAMDANDTTLLDIQLKALKGDLSETETLLRDANAQLSPLNTLQIDDDFMRERDDDAAKVGEIIAAVRTGTAAHYKALKNLQNQAEEAWRQSTRSEKYAVQQLAGDEQGTQDLKKELYAAMMKAHAFEDMAAKARDARNAKGLANARAAFDKLDIGMLKIQVEIRGKVLAKNEKDFGDRDISDDTLKTLKDGYRDTRFVFEQAQGHLATLVEIDKRLAAMAVKPIDIKKARDAMGLDAKADAQLAKVFGGPPAGWEKGLDGIGKTFKTGTSGKKYLDSLRSAGIVPE
ncbi:MAG: hypothetical protein ACKVQR_01085, partial [Aquabacterium sp.]